MLRVQPVMNTFSKMTQNVSNNKQSQQQNTNLLNSTNQYDSVSFSGLKKHIIKAIEHLKIARNSKDSEIARTISRERSEHLLERHNSELKKYTQRRERQEAERIKRDWLSDTVK